MKERFENVGCRWHVTVESLNLRNAAPRGPREKLAGIAFTARLVDKLRATLPDGELNGYLAVEGFSELWSYYTKIDLLELRDTIAMASSEADVERWIENRTVGIDKERINDKMERFTSNRTPEKDRERFEELYPENLRRQHLTMFDLLEADDARLYSSNKQSMKKTR